MILARQVKITQAKPKDAKNLQTLLRETWIDTYVSKENNISKEDIESINFLSRENIDRKSNEFQKSIPGKSTAIALFDNDIVGMCSFFVDGSVGTIKAIYVKPKYQRLGVGSKLFRYALDHLKKCDPIVIELARDNKKACSFYSKHGFIENNNRGEYKLPNGKTFPTVCMEYRK